MTQKKIGTIGLGVGAAFTTFSTVLAAQMGDNINPTFVAAIAICAAAGAAITAGFGLWVAES